jgi:hypothetical protein
VTSGSAQRELVGRIHHTVFAYASRASRDRAQEEFGSALGLSDWTDLGDAAGSVNVVISFSAGIELVSPTAADSAIAEHLAAHGEGFWCFVFGVDDLATESARVQAQGRPAVPLPKPPSGVFKHYAVVREANIGMVGGVAALFGEFVPHRERFSDRGLLSGGPA